MSILDAIQEMAITRGGYGVSNMTGNPLPRGPKGNLGQARNRVLSSGGAQGLRNRSPRGELVPSDGISSLLGAPKADPRPTVFPSEEPRNLDQQRSRALGEPPRRPERLKLRALANEIVNTEGSYTPGKNDRRGATKFGINKDSLSNYTGHSATDRDIKNLDRETALDIIGEDYIQKPGIDKLPMKLARIVGDSSVNHGQSASIKQLQKSLRNLGFDAGKIDGYLGYNTKEALAKALSIYDPEVLVNDIKEQRAKLYKQIAKKDPTQKVFLKGWLNRLEKF